MNDKRSGNTRKGLLLMAQGAAIAALYVILTFVSQALGLMSFDVQIRFSEALCIMPFFTAAAVPGLTLGCVLANLLTGGAPWDIVFGSLATLIGAAVCRAVSKRLRGKGKDTLAVWLSPVPNILANTAILPFVISWVYDSPISIPLLAVFVFPGEAVSCGIGIPLAFALKKREKYMFGK